MDPTAFITRIRDHYVDQFRAFAAQQRAHCTQGASEVKFQVNEQSELFDRLYCVDFIKNDGAVEMVELQPEYILTFEPIAGAFGNSSFLIKHMRWDDVLIRHDLDEVPADRLSDWFQLWFDPEDARHVPGAELSEIIHSMVIHRCCALALRRLAGLLEPPYPERDAAHRLGFAPVGSMDALTSVSFLDAEQCFAAWIAETRRGPLDNSHAPFSAHATVRAVLHTLAHYSRGPAGRYCSSG